MVEKKPNIGDMKMTDNMTKIYDGVKWIPILNVSSPTFTTDSSWDTGIMNYSYTTTTNSTSVPRTTTPAPVTAEKILKTLPDLNNDQLDDIIDAAIEELRQRKNLLGQLDAE